MKRLSKDLMTEAERSCFADFGRGSIAGTERLFCRYGAAFLDLGKVILRF